MQDSWAYKTVKGSAPARRLFTKVEIFDILGPAFPLPDANWNEILEPQADPGARPPCQVWRESVQRVAPEGRKSWFFGSLPPRGSPAANN